MKRLEKQEMKRVQGGKILAHACHDLGKDSDGNGTSNCTAVYQLADGRLWRCDATYNYDGTYAKGGDINCDYVK